jgi:predicted dehydrogenase
MAFMTPTAPDENEAWYSTRIPSLAMACYRCGGGPKRAHRKQERTTMPDRIAVAVIGCGFFAQNHLHSWKDLASEGAELVAVCDVDPAKAKSTAEAFGVPSWYADAAEMFDTEKLNLVDIVTQMNTHQRLVDLAIARRLPTIVQKPFGPNLATCQAMADAAGKAGVFLAVHENFRFQRPMREVAAALKSGVIGQPSWARISFRTGYDIYSGQPYLMKEDRLILLDVGVHVLDLARFFLGDVAHLVAETQRRNPRVKGEDTGTILLRHQSGAVSVVECTYESRLSPDHFPETRLEIEGSRGSIVLDYGFKMSVAGDGGATTTNVDAPVLKWAERPWHVVQESVFATCAHMLDAVKAGRDASTCAADNLKTFALCEAGYESAATSRVVAV